MYVFVTEIESFWNFYLISIIEMLHANIMDLNKKVISLQAFSKQADGHFYEIMTKQTKPTDRKLGVKRSHTSSNILPLLLYGSKNVLKYMVQNFLIIYKELEIESEREREREREKERESFNDFL